MLISSVMITETRRPARFLYASGSRMMNPSDVIFASNLINIFSPSFVRGSAIGSMRRHIGFIDPIYRQRKYRDNSPNSKSSTPLPISKESKRMMFRPETKKSGGMEITKPLLISPVDSLKSKSLIIGIAIVIVLREILAASILEAVKVEDL